MLGGLSLQLPEEEDEEDEEDDELRDGVDGAAGTDLPFLGTQ